jgi:hypothetical protein
MVFDLVEVEVEVELRAHRVQSLGSGVLGTNNTVRL